MNAFECSRRRAYRRNRIAVIGARRRVTHLFFVHPPHGALPAEPDCACEQSVFFFAKRRALVCGCSKKQRGCPKIGHGICHAYGYRPTVTSRHRNRLLCHRIVTGQVDPWNI